MFKASNTVPVDTLNMVVPSKTLGFSFFNSRVFLILWNAALSCSFPVSIMYVGLKRAAAVSATNH